MKKLLLAPSLIFLTGWYFVQAQITIDSSDYGSIGDTVILAVDSMPAGISVGNGGANQVWDFSALGIDYFDTLRFLNPAGTTYGSTYPASNLAVENSSETSYIVKSDSELVIDGVYLKEFINQPINFAINYEDDLKTLMFPSFYLTSFSDTSSLDTIFRDPQFGATIDSVRLKRTIISTSTFDAWGDVTTPAGTFACLRQNRIEISIDSVWIKIFGTWNWFTPTLPLINVPNPNYDTSRVFSWWAKGKGLPVLELRTNKTADTINVASFFIWQNFSSHINNQSNITCNGLCNGQATAAVNGGTNPFTFIWDSSTGNQSGATATGLCAGNYSISIIDATGDTSITIAMITEPAVLVASSSAGNIICNGDSTNVTVTATGGTSPYTGVGSFSITTGTYSFTVTDVNGCTSTTSITVTEPTVFTISISLLIESTCDTCYDGKITVAATGGNIPYSYFWSDSSESANNSGLLPGFYNVTVTDAFGCTASIDSIEMTVGIKEFTVQILKFYVYPNPVSESLIITTAGYSQIIFELMDITGRVVSHKTIYDNHGSPISVSGITNGLYTYRIMDLNGRALQYGKVSVNK